MRRRRSTYEAYDDRTIGVSDRQTRNKMLAASDLLQPSRLLVLDNDFLDSKLSPGRVYFRNVQKLARTAGLARGGRNLRQHLDVGRPRQHDRRRHR